jgi:hypothetical protein
VEENVTFGFADGIYRRIVTPPGQMTFVRSFEAFFVLSVTICERRGLLCPNLIMRSIISPLTNIIMEKLALGTHWDFMISYGVLFLFSLRSWIPNFAIVGPHVRWVRQYL